MKRLVCLVALLLTTWGFSQEFNIRGFKFGDDIEVVKQKEKSSFIEEMTEQSITILIYSDTIFGEDAGITFYFIEKKLYSISYFFGNLKLKNWTECENALKQYTGYISSKYGESDWCYDNGSEEYYTDSYDLRYIGLCNSSFNILNVFDRPPNRIGVSLSSAGSIPVIIITYVNMPLHTKAEETKIRDSEGKF
jgi:hypothetical protein